MHHRWLSRPLLACVAGACMLLLVLRPQPNGKDEGGDRAHWLNRAAERSAHNAAVPGGAGVPPNATGGGANPLSPRTHPLENACRYPVIAPDDPSIAAYVRRPRTFACRKTQASWSSYDAQRGLLYLHADLADWRAKEPHCYWRPVYGALRDKPNDVRWSAYWEKLSFNAEHRLAADTFVVRCYNASAPNVTRGRVQHRDDLYTEEDVHAWFSTEYVYQRAYAQQRPITGRSVPLVDRHKGLSVDIIVLDSTSLNQFKRHARRSWRFMKDVMGFHWLEGYTKVADNSAVNLMPLLAGLRYVNQSVDFPSELPEDEVLDLDSIDFLWKHMPAGCATLWNDDVMNSARGLFHYPRKQLSGWHVKPTDYYLRPWHVFNYKYVVDDKANAHCLAGERYADLTLAQTEQFVRAHSDRCHFSFTFSTETTHDDSAMLESVDDALYNMLHRLHYDRMLENTALVIMGDHGQRIARIKGSYIGRIEERMSFFSIHLPKWFASEHADLVSNLVDNRHRLTANYDAHQTLYQLATGDWAAASRHGAHGSSLLAPIAPERDCARAGIPPQYCVCMGPRAAPLKPDVKAAALALLAAQLRCIAAGAAKLRLLNATAYTVSKEVRHGVKYFDAASVQLLKAQPFMELNYVELTVVAPHHRHMVLIKARLRRDMKAAAASDVARTLSMAAPVLIEGIEGCDDCGGWSPKYLDEYCARYP